ncbi:hypothetical protein M9434_005794 [Picochlorum sp. BPE23]|nr:hypothetical protein M9434_005794 [Picochlorum sp. BPE23]
MKAVFSVLLVALFAGAVAPTNATFTHGGPTPEYFGEFIERMEAIHAEAKANLAPLVNITGEYIIDALEAFQNLTEAAVASKKARSMMKGAKVDWASRVEEIIAAANEKADAILATAEAKMDSVSAAWEGKHAEYDVKAKIEELRVSFEETMATFLGAFKHTKTGRRLSGMFKNHTMAFEETKANIQSMIDGWTPTWEKKSFTHSWAPLPEFDFAGHLESKSAELEAKLSDAKANIAKAYESWSMKLKQE